MNTPHVHLELALTVYHILLTYATTIESVHEALAYFEITCFTAQMTIKRPCESVEAIERDLLQIERDAGATLQELAQDRRIVLLMEGAMGLAPLELAIALALLVAAMSQSWPDILSIHYDERRPDAVEVINQMPLYDLLSRYVGRQVSSAWPPNHEQGIEHKKSEPA